MVQIFWNAKVCAVTYFSITMLAKKRLITFRVLISQIANPLHPNDQFLTDIKYSE